MTTPDYLEQELAPEQLQKLHDEAAELFYDFLLAAAPPKDGLMVIGCSTSEILGGHIGKNGWLKPPWPRPKAMALRQPLSVAST